MSTSNFLFTKTLSFLANWREEFNKLTNFSRQFAKKLSVLVKRKFDVDNNVYYTTFKTGFYFVVYKFTKI